MYSTVKTLRDIARGRVDAACFRWPLAARETLWLAYHLGVAQQAAQIVAVGPVNVLLVSQVSKAIQGCQGCPDAELSRQARALPTAVPCVMFCIPCLGSVAVGVVGVVSNRESCNFCAMRNS